MTPNPSLKRSANGSPPGPVRGAIAFSTARAWRATVVSRLARTLGSKMQVISVSRQIQRLRRELSSHEAAAPQGSNPAQIGNAPLSRARFQISLESKNAFSTKASVSIFEPRVQSRLTSSAGNVPARAKPDAANRGETVCNRAVSRYRAAMFKKTLPTNFVATKRVQGKIRLSPMQALVLRSTLLPNPSLKRSANGGPPGPVCGAPHFPQPGPGVPPLAPA